VESSPPSPNPGRKSKAPGNERQDAKKHGDKTTCQNNPTLKKTGLADNVHRSGGRYQSEKEIKCHVNQKKSKVIIPEGAALVTEKDRAKNGMDYSLTGEDNQFVEWGGAQRQMLGVQKKQKEHGQRRKGVGGKRRFSKTMTLKTRRRVR